MSRNPSSNHLTHSDADIVIQDPDLAGDYWDSPPSNRKRLKHGEEMAGEKRFEKSVFERILELNNKVGQPQKIEYLKPSKAALFGLQVRFQNQKKADNIYGKAKSKKKQEQSMYHVNS